MFLPTIVGSQVPLLLNVEVLTVFQSSLNFCLSVTSCSSRKPSSQKLTLSYCLGIQVAQKKALKEPKKKMHALHDSSAALTVGIHP